MKINYLKEKVGAQQSLKLAVSHRGEVYVFCATFDRKGELCDVIYPSGRLEKHKVVFYLPGGITTSSAESAFFMMQYMHKNLCNVKVRYETT